MKKIKEMAFAVLIAFSISACSDMNSLHEPYLEQGERVYAAKIDSAIAYIGINQQILNVYTAKQRACSGVVRWNVGNDSVTFDVPSPTPEFIRVVVPDLEEGNYTYDIFCYDKYGNISIGEELTSTVISMETYQEKLRIAKTSFYYSEYDRLVDEGGAAPSGPEAKISNAQNFNGSAWFMWENDALPGAKIIFRYTNRDGKEITYTFDGNTCKKGAWCSTLKDALCEPKDQIKFYYHTEYPGSDIEADISTRIDLGEEYEENIRYYDYSDKVSIHTDSLIYPEIEDNW